jgi:acyl-CoA hydrolase
MSYEKEYQEKLTTAATVAGMIESGMGIKLGYFTSKPVILIQELAKRHDELKDVLLVGCSTAPPIPEVIQYGDSFTWWDWHWSKLTRALRPYFSNIVYAPITYHLCCEFVRDQTVNQGKQTDWVWQQVGPMDQNGFFNFGPSISESITSFEVAKYKCVEVNKNMPRCLGGSQESVHISMIDYIIEAPDDQMIFAAPDVPEPTEVETKLANHLVEYIHDGSCLQLGIGGLPNALGHVIKNTDLKDLGIHSEMFVDAYVDMIDSGQANGRKKNIDMYKAVYTFAVGTQRLYDWMHENTGLAGYSVSYVNDPRIIAQLDNMVSINQALQVDLYTQISAESMGTEQITGHGGMTDFILGSQWSKGGKSFLCLPSTHTTKDGKLVSRIVPTFSPGTCTSVSRHLVDYVATEYGVRKMKAQNQWVRTERIIEIAHPQFRDELVQAANDLKIWTRTNKID